MSRFAAFWLAPDPQPAVLQQVRSTDTYRLTPLQEASICGFTVMSRRPVFLDENENF